MIGKWSFRRKLTVLITGIFVISALCLLLLQYFLVKWLMLRAVSVSVESGGPKEVGQPPDAGQQDMLVMLGDDAGDDAGSMTAVTIATNASVLRGLQFWSVIVLIVFAGLAILAANFLAGRSMSRVSQIAAIARQITGANREERLDLPGPDDEIKELGDTIDGMLDRLDQALTRQESFVSAASHELRTPLATTRTALEVPYTQGKFSEETARSVERALEANARSEELIAGLLTLASVQASGNQTVTAAQARGAYVQTVAENLPLAEVNEIQFDVVTPRGETAEPGLLSVALNNLVKNAIIHGQKGGQVDFLVDLHADRAVYTVLNEGAVMSEQTVVELAQPFNRGTQTRLGGGAGPRGLGLGLSVVDAVSQHLGASLSLLPRREGGLEVTLDVPLQPAVSGDNQV